MKNQKDRATKAVYATLGAPVVITRRVRHLSERQVKELLERISGYSERLAASAQGAVDDYATEGEKVAKQIRGTAVVEELQSRVDLDKVTDRVEKLRDQLEVAMQTWRENFNPAEGKGAAKKVVVETAEAAPAEQTTAKPATRKPAATTTARKPAPKASTAKTSTSKASTPKTTTAKTSTAKATTAG